MNQIQVCLSPALLPMYELEGKTIIVTDVLRATSTMISALEVGVNCVIPVASRAEAKEFIGKEGHLVAGERDGKKVEGFDLGNSPLLLKENKEMLQSKTLVMTTTNGTKAIKLSEGADKIYIGALTNVAALAEVLKEDENELLVVCAGWKNRVNIEDTLFAGALCEALQDSKKLYGDASIMSLQLFQNHKDDLISCIKNATHYQRLKSHGIEDDIRFCMSLNTSNIVPYLKNGAIVCE